MGLSTNRVRIDIWLADIQEIRSKTTNRFLAYKSNNCIQQQSDKEESIADVDVANILFDFNHSLIEELDSVRAVRMLR